MAALRIAVAVFAAAAFRGALGGGRYEVIRSGSARKSEETDDNVEYSYPPMSVLKLNRFIFDGNVVQCLGHHTDHWIVQFCPAWYGPCQKFLPIFKNASIQWQDKLNSDIVMRSRARFAEVDCATDKELCNDQRVEDYPTVVHYFAGERVSRWTADSASEFKGLDRWVNDELRSAKGTSRKAKKQDNEETRDSAQMKLLSLLVFIPLFIGPIVIVARGARLEPSAESPSSTPELRPRATVEKLPEEREPSSPLAEVSGDAGGADSSAVDTFMPTEWAEEFARSRRSSSMEL